MVFILGGGWFYRRCRLGLGLQVEAFETMMLDKVVSYRLLAGADTCAG